jgi:hypothetical protein
MNMEKLIFELLDESIGQDDFNDYENKESVLECAIEAVQERDDLMMGCGVGPLMGHIEKWVDKFEKETKIVK